MTGTWIALAALAVAIGAAPAYAADHVVNDDGAPNGAEPAPCDTDFDNLTIQAAIGAAGVGDNILVCPGTYMEDLTIGTDGLTIAAVDRTDKANTTILGVASAPAAGFPTAAPNIDLQANNVTITGFTIQSPSIDGANNYTSGLVIDGTGNKIYHNRFLVSSGTPGSQAIQTWNSVANVVSVGDITGLTILANSFESSKIDTTKGLGYEGVFVNPQAADVGPNPVIIAFNHFSGKLYRAIGIVRSFTDAKGNEMSTFLRPDNVAEFGGDIPIGIKLFAGTMHAKIIANEIDLKRKHGRFALGIVVQDEATDNVIVDNIVKQSSVWDCLDETSMDAETVANYWDGNDGRRDSPDGICSRRKHAF